MRDEKTKTFHSEIFRKGKKVKPHFFKIYNFFIPLLDQKALLHLDTFWFQRTFFFVSILSHCRTCLAV